MAKVDKKNNKKEIKKKVQKNDAVKDDITPKLVDDNNNIVYDGEKELQKIVDSVAIGDINIEITEEAQKGLDMIKELSNIDNLINSDKDKAVQFAKETLPKLEEIAGKLEESIKKRSGSINKALKSDFTSYWGGVTDGWNY